MTDRIVHDIEALAALFKAGRWDELRVEYIGMSLLLSNDPSTLPIGEEGQVPQPVSPAVPTLAARGASAGLAAEVPTAAVQTKAADPGWIAVVAPNLGTFYRSPKPGAAAFVEVGQRVESDTEICLLEVMKLFTSVKAGISGAVRRIDAADGELVEGGQVLFHIEPA